MDRDFVGRFSFGFLIRKVLYFVWGSVAVIGSVSSPVFARSIGDIVRVQRGEDILYAVVTDVETSELSVDDFSLELSYIDEENKPQTLKMDQEALEKADVSKDIFGYKTQVPPLPLAQPTNSEENKKIYGDLYRRLMDSALKRGATSSDPLSGNYEPFLYLDFIYTDLELVNLLNEDDKLKEQLKFRLRVAGNSQIERVRKDGVEQKREAFIKYEFNKKFGIESDLSLIKTAFTFNIEKVWLLAATNSATARGMIKEVRDIAGEISSHPAVFGVETESLLRDFDEVTIKLEELRKQRESDVSLEVRTMLKDLAKRASR